MRFFGWVSALAVLLIAFVAGAVGYNFGLSANIAASGVTPVAYPMYRWGLGFGFGHIFGFIFFLIILFVIFGAIRRAAWGGHRGYGPGGWKGGYGYGPGGWRHGAAGDEFDRWHRRAHGEPDTTDGMGSSASPPAG